MNIDQLNLVLSELHGTHEILHFEEGLPIVFLFDENHEDIDCKKANIASALYLINNIEIGLIGVETRLGGQNWNEETETYNDEKYPLSYQCDFREFENALEEDYSKLIIGVECIGMRTKLIDLWEKGIIDRNSMEDHAVNKLRSKHFIKTLFEEYIAKGIKGHMILNCGLDHNSHIKEFISKEEIFDFAKQKSSYVRLNTIQ